jgi:hypothetical protein
MMEIKKKWKTFQIPYVQETGAFYLAIYNPIEILHFSFTKSGVVGQHSKKLAVFLHS